MINPIEQIKREKKLSTSEMAILTDRSIPDISHLIAGDYRVIPVKVLKSLARFGYNPEDLQKDYRTFRSEQQKKLEQKVMAV